MKTFLLVDDLIFLTRIKAVASANEVISVKKPEDLLNIQEGDRVILDLSFKRFDWRIALKDIPKEVERIAFFPHTAVELLEGAEECGFINPLPRSTFVNELNSIFGFGYLTNIFLIAVLGALVYAGYYILPWHYEYYEFQSQADQLVRVASVDTDKELRHKLWGMMRDYDLPFTADDVVIRRGNDTITLEVSWEREFGIPWGEEFHHLHTFHFDVFAEAPIR